MTVKVPGMTGGRGPRVLRRGIGARAEVGGDEIDAVGGGVVGHGARAGLRGQALDGGIAGSGGVDDGENSVAAGDEGERVGVAEAGGVRAVADGGVGEELAGGGVDDGSFLAVADREEAMAGGVEGEAGG